MKLLSFGCSVTFGTELQDTLVDSPQQSASTMTWPALIAQRLAAEYHCFALGGSGNLCILDRVLNISPMASDHLVIINWTYSDRFDFTDPAAQHAGDGIIDYQTLRPSGDDVLAKLYFRHLQSAYRDKFTSLAYMHTALISLQQRQTKFLMTSLDHSLLDDRYHAPLGLRTLQQQLKSHVRDFEGMGFVDWAKHRGFDFGAGNHPLEQAHAAAAELMMPSIDAILHRA